MPLPESKTRRTPGGTAAINRRMLSIPIMPISVILVITNLWILRHMLTWWLCTARLGDEDVLWMGSESSTISPHSMFLTIAGLTCVFTWLEWWHERAHLGVRDLTRSVIYLLAITVSASTVVLLVKFAEMLPLF